MQTARDLMLLAAVAFQNKRYEDAGALFTTALSSDDAEEFINQLNSMNNPDAEPLVKEAVASDGKSVSEIAAVISKAIESTSADDEEDSDEEDEDEVEDDEESDDEIEDDESDEEDSEAEASVSTSSGIERRNQTGERKLIISGINSPIKLKQ